MHGFEGIYSLQQLRSPFLRTTPKTNNHVKISQHPSGSFWLEELNKQITTAHNSSQEVRTSERQKHLVRNGPKCATPYMGWLNHITWTYHSIISLIMSLNHITQAYHSIISLDHITQSHHSIISLDHITQSYVCFPVGIQRAEKSVVRGQSIAGGGLRRGLGLLSFKRATPIFSTVWRRTTSVTRGQSLPQLLIRSHPSIVHQ